MKKILSILGTITLIGTSTTSLVACNKPQQQYTEKELADLKENNNIKTNDGILEWIAPQEKPFKNIDNKYYFVVWRGDENNDWRSIKFQINTSTINPFVIDNDGDRDLIIADLLGDLVISIGFKKSVASWINDNGTYFGAVYRWNLLNNKPAFNLIIDNNGNVRGLMNNKKIIYWNDFLYF